MYDRDDRRSFRLSTWGVLIGPFAGAVIGELFGGKKSAEAFKAG